MYTKTHSFDLVGIDTQVIEVEVSVRSGLSNFTLIGLADRSLSEAKERIICAINSSGTKFRAQHTVVNLAPACLAKSGTHLDVAIAVGYLAATQQVPAVTHDVAFLGELNLNGEIKAVNFLRTILLSDEIRRFKRVYVPRENIAGLNVQIEGCEVVPTGNLQEVIDDLIEKRHLPRYVSPQLPAVLESAPEEISSVHGNFLAKRALTISAVGQHHLLLRGVAGVGKTMLAKTLPFLLPDLKLNQLHELTKIYELAGMLPSSAVLSSTPPLRMPHSNITVAAMTGGGTTPKPGEVSLAHCGVLVLDEAAEFSPQVINSLRQPLDSRNVRVSRQKFNISLPANFQLVMTVNPCPCGNYGSSNKRCTCNRGRVKSYQNKISSPVIDRLDLGVDIFESQSSSQDLHVKTSKEIKAEIVKAREFAVMSRGQLFPNALLTHSSLEGMKSDFDKSLKFYLKESMMKLGYSWRRYYHTMRVALSIADIEQRKVTKQDLEEALALQQPLFNYIVGG